MKAYRPKSRRFDDTALQNSVRCGYVIPVSGQMLVHPHFGTPQVAHTHTLDILVGSYRFSAIEVVGDNHGQEIIVGRNLLNKLVLLLDGPQNLTDVWDSRPARLPHP